jgi:hypothetical protein
VLLLFTCLFLFIEIVGKPFAPACAIALIPMIIPQKIYYCTPRGSRRSSGVSFCGNGLFLKVLPMETLTPFGLLCTGIY